LNGFYCFWSSDRSRSSVKVVVSSLSFDWVLGSNPCFVIRLPVSCSFVFFFLIISCNFLLSCFFFKKKLQRLKFLNFSTKKPNQNLQINNFFAINRTSKKLKAFLFTKITVDLKISLGLWYGFWTTCFPLKIWNWETFEQFLPHESFPNHQINQNYFFLRL
jgi:hypothetical protein